MHTTSMACTQNSTETHPFLFVLYSTLRAVDLVCVSELGHATSFVVSFVLALNRVDVVAMVTLLVLHVEMIGYHVLC